MTVMEALQDRTDPSNPFVAAPFGEVVDGVHWSVGTDGKQMLALRADLALSPNPRAKLAPILSAFNPFASWLFLFGDEPVRGRWHEAFGDLGLTRSLGCAL